MLDLPEALEEKFQKASDILEDHDKFRLITHYDADGIASAAVLSSSLMKSQKGFHVRFVNKVPDQIEEGLPTIFTDIGNSELDMISDLDDSVIVLDHHQVEDSVEADRGDHVYINPHDHGIDGAQEISGATLSFLLVITQNKKDWSLVHYALAGAAADKQNLDGFTGMNKNIIDGAYEKGLIREEKRLYIDGRNIKDALMKACDPYFPGISGREKKIEDVLSDLGIDPETPADELNPQQSRQLTTVLVLSLLEREIPTSIIEGIRGEHQITEFDGMDIDILYKLMNACARTSNAGTALSFCLGEKRSLEKARELRSEYRDKMIERLHGLERDGLERKKYIQYFIEDKKERKGELAGIGMLYLFDQSKPAFGISYVNGDADISARGTKKMVEEGLDLGRLCREVSEELDGSGGGHDIAAGASVDEDRVDEFLEDMDERVGSILG